MFLIKILAWVILIALILSSAFFQNILIWMWWAINSINGDFWAFLPTEIRVFFSLIILWILFWLVYAFKK